MKHSTLFLTGVAAAALITSSAEAESADETDGAAPTEQQPSSVGTGANDCETIIVTARRRTETSQAVPLAISVVGGEHIDNTGSFNVGRLQQLTPTL